MEKGNNMSSSSSPSGSGSDHPGLKQPQNLHISKHSRNIKKPPLPPGAPKPRPPILTFKKKTIITDETPATNHPPPSSSSTDRPLGIIPLPGSPDYNIIPPPLPLFKTPLPRLYYRPKFPDSDFDSDSMVQMGSSTSPSASYPPERKRLEQPLQISKHSQRIKKPPTAPNPRQPIIKHEVEPKIIHVKTPAEFKYIVQLLTGSPDHPPPSLPSEDSDLDHAHRSSSHCPLGILSPTPTSLPLVSPTAFTPPLHDPLDALVLTPPSPDPLDAFLLTPPPPPDPLDALLLTPPPPPPDPLDTLLLPPPPSEEISIYDYDWEDTSYPIPIPILPANFMNIPSSSYQSPYYPFNFPDPFD